MCRMAGSSFTTARAMAALWLVMARAVAALLTQRDVLPVAPWLTAPMVTSLRRNKGIGGMQRLVCSRVVPPLVVPEVFGGSSGVWAAHVVIVNSSLRMARTMIRIVGGQAPAILSPTVGSSVRISVCHVIEGPTGRIEFVGAHPVALAAAALAAVLRDRGWPPPAVHPGLSFLSQGCLSCP